MAHAGFWLQITIALFGILWKLNEGYALLYVPEPMNISPLLPTNLEPHSLLRYLDVLNSTAIKSVASDWPYFALHLFLYLGQLLPLVLIALSESFLRGGSRSAFVTLILLSGLSIIFGFSIAAPAVSVLLSRQNLNERSAMNSGRTRRLFFGPLLLLSAATHIGAFAIAVAATWIPGIFTVEAAHAFHVNHSLVGMIEAAQTDLPSPHIRYARLRQINEMTGTSSLFLLNLELLCRTIRAKNMAITKELVLWIFLISLVAGPATGSAVVLILRDSILKGTVAWEIVTQRKTLSMSR